MTQTAPSPTHVAQAQRMLELQDELNTYTNRKDVLKVKIDTSGTGNEDLYNFVYQQLEVMYQG